MPTYERLPDGTLRTAIPEPFWYRGWKSLWMYKPACLQCHTIYSNRQQYDDHFVVTHAYDGEGVTMPARGPWGPSRYPAPDADLTPDSRRELNKQHLAWEIKRLRDRTARFDHSASYLAYLILRERVSLAAWWVLSQLFNTQDHRAIHLILAVRMIRKLRRMRPRTPVQDCVLTCLIRLAEYRSPRYIAPPLIQLARAGYRFLDPISADTTRPPSNPCLPDLDVLYPDPDDTVR